MRLSVDDEEGEGKVGDDADGDSRGQGDYGGGSGKKLCPIFTPICLMGKKLCSFSYPWVKKDAHTYLY